MVLTGITKQHDLKCEDMFIVYAVIAVVCMSLIINGFMLTS